MVFGEGGGHGGVVDGVGLVVGLVPLLFVLWQPVMTSIAVASRTRAILMSFLYAAFTRNST